MSLSIPKKTGTYADTLQAIGLADLLYELSGELPEIIDQGCDFKISTKQWEPGEWCAPTPGYPYIWDSKKEPKPPSGPFLDYRSEVKKRDILREALKSAAAQNRARIKNKLQEQGLEMPEAPKPELALATILASMRKNWEGDRQLYRWLTEDAPRALSWTKHKLGLDGSPTDDPKWSNTQFLNPTTGKGVHSPKTTARAPNAINPALTDPFEDWLKFRASFIAMLAYRNGDDFKLFVLEPALATSAMLAEIATDLRTLNLWGGVRLDIHAVLRCTEELILHSDLVGGGSAHLRGRTPRDLISGLRQAYFKSLGTAAALMNEALLPLPDWFNIRNRDDAEKMLAIIEEFIGQPGKAGCLAILQENHSDEGATLQQFRDWLATGSLHDFLSFHAEFAVHLMHKRDQQEWTRPFSTENLTFLLSKEKYSMNEIVTNPGFLSIARAIRNATIYSVGDRAVEINTRFGLAQEWKQKLRSGKAEFIGAVADFVQQYNWEVINRLKRKYHVVGTTDLDELSRLIDLPGVGVETVGLLLLAYGYAQAPKTEAKIPAAGGNE